MDVAAFLEHVRQSPGYDGQLAHVEVLPARPGEFAEPAFDPPSILAELLASRGIERLYSHQVEAWERARLGQDLVVVTGTASGKTLCYHLPVLEALLADSNAKALYLFPTKALAQDQLKGLLELTASHAEAGKRITPGVYDGDTPPAQRRRIQAEANLVLTNPDMLHASLLPNHPRWAGFWSSLRYIVVDEAHAYRGILGANVALVLRRLARICEHYGSGPTFLAASATIANPQEHVSRLLGRETWVIDRDGAPRGAKSFVLWNPAPLGKDRLAQRSAADDATWLMVEALEWGAQALVFTRTRQAAELVQRYAQQALAQRWSNVADKIRAYRGGYLPNERRAIEAALFAGELRGVAATNALELGVDIGSLDVAILAGYPGTIASSWQQAGRCGRRHAESLAILIAGNDPIDHYLLRRPDYFFSRSPESAVVDPENPYVLARHAKAAAFELPLDENDVERFGPLTWPLAEMLRDARELNEVAGKFYFAGETNPAARMSLRLMSDNSFSITRIGVAEPTGERPPVGKRGRQPLAKEHEVLAQVDAISAPELVYPEAVYLHNAETYIVRRLDLDGKIAYVEREETDYYTQAVLESKVKLIRERASCRLGAGFQARSASDLDARLPCPTDARVPAEKLYGRVPAERVEDVGLAERAPEGFGPEETGLAARFAFGEVEVTWQTVAFKKIKFGTRENIGLGPVDIPAQTLATTAVWLTPHASVRRAMKDAGERVSEGLVGLRNLTFVALPLLAMLDSRDLGGVVDSHNTGESTLILYDRFPGGLGYCEQGYARRGELLATCWRILTECPCEEGCPSCVGLANLRPSIHADPDLSRGFPIPSKKATLTLLRLLAVDPTNAESPLAAIPRLG